jgi:hypothetical protein
MCVGTADENAGLTSYMKSPMGGDFGRENLSHGSPEYLSSFFIETTDE